VKVEPVICRSSCHIIRSTWNSVAMEIVVVAKFCALGAGPFKEGASTVIVQDIMSNCSALCRYECTATDLCTHDSLQYAVAYLFCRR